ncbi:MAG: hypothetical protein LBT23_10665 [Synergistaceae bacterium]|nr:hypothetical protein [Synergistaceae bacterium]
MADYPDWVLKFKKKGTYVNCVKGKYYLYAAHSERVPGTKKIRRVSDGYLGRVTEKEGFIPAKGKLAEDVFVCEYGLSKTITLLCARIHAGLKREFRANADYVLASGALFAMHGARRAEFYEASWLSRKFPGLDLNKPPTDKQAFGAERTCRMIQDTLKKRFGTDYGEALALLPLVRKVYAGSESRLAVIGGGIAQFIEKHGLNLCGEDD